MVEWYLEYPHSSVKRNLGKGFQRTFENRLVAWHLNQDYYDGKRENGYGGFKYDGRWKNAINSLAKRYGIDNNSSVLEVGCKKGFFLHDLKNAFHDIRINGIENHPYPIENGMVSVRDKMMIADYQNLPFKDGEFDFVFSFAAIYMLHLGAVISALKEIQRVGKGKSYVTVGAYYNQEDLALFREWTLIGTTILHVDDWTKVFNEAGYTGDYGFTTAKSLNLTRE